MNTTISYRVDYSLYQYNSGASDNGIKKFEQHFPNLEEAKDFQKILFQWLDDKEEGYAPRQEYIDFIDAHIWDGYLEKVSDIYKDTITTEKIV